VRPSIAAAPCLVPSDRAVDVAYRKRDAKARAS
jgi:hypothetical protein